MGLTVIIACIMVPILLIQNAYLLYKRQDPILDEKIHGLSKFYFMLDLACLASWVYFVIR